MLKLYCQSCGGLNVYSKDKPKFCQGCGKAFGSIGVPKNLKAQLEAQASENDDDDVEIHDLPNIDGLLVDIDVRGPQTDTIGSIAGSQKKGTQVNFNNVPEPEYSEEDFKSEAGTLRPPS